MFNGLPARIATAMVICAQLAAMFFVISIPAPQSLPISSSVLSRATIDAQLQ